MRGSCCVAKGRCRGGGSGKSYNYAVQGAPPQHRSRWISSALKSLTFFYWFPVMRNCGLPFRPELLPRLFQFNLSFLANGFICAMSISDNWWQIMLADSRWHPSAHFLSVYVFIADVSIQIVKLAVWLTDWLPGFNHPPHPFLLAIIGKFKEVSHRKWQRVCWWLISNWWYIPFGILYVCTCECMSINYNDIL